MKFHILFTYESSFFDMNQFYRIKSRLIGNPDGDQILLIDGGQLLCTDGDVRQIQIPNRCLVRITNPKEHRGFVIIEACGHALDIDIAHIALKGDKCGRCTVGAVDLNITEIDVMIDRTRIVAAVDGDTAEVIRPVRQGKTNRTVFKGDVLCIVVFLKHDAVARAFVRPGGDIAENDVIGARGAVAVDLHSAASSPVRIKQSSTTESVQSESMTPSEKMR